MDDLVATFERDGFLRLETLAARGDIEGLQAAFDRLFAPDADIAPEDRVELAGGGALAQVLNPERYVPELLESAAYRAAETLARRLLGEEATAMGNHAILKTPGGPATPWHQDEAYWDAGYDHHAVSVWVPLGPATPENGCMWFAPGSHLGPVRRHRRSRAGQALTLDEAFPADEVVAGEVPVGGATVHAGRTLHYAGANGTDEPRRAVIMMFSRPGTPLAQPREAPWLACGA